MNPQDRERLTAYIAKLEQKSKNILGYPVSTDFDYSELYPLFHYPLNNVGDPMIDSTYALNSRAFEREIIEFFAELFKAPSDDFWGYVTNGGSEGNLYALYLAREL
jgi:histidine decarboxylase